MRLGNRSRPLTQPVLTNKARRRHTHDGGALSVGSYEETYCFRIVWRRVRRLARRFLRRSFTEETFGAPAFGAGVAPDIDEPETPACYG